MVSPLAFDYLRDIFERAMAAPLGIRITCRNHAEAMALKGRLHYFRDKDKAANKGIYPEDHPLHNVSAWSRLVCRVPAKGRPNDHVLTVSPVRLEHLVIEPIEAPDEEDSSTLPVEGSSPLKPLTD